MRKRYRVTGGSVVAGHKPGEEFEHEYRPHEEAALIAGGAIRLVGITGTTTRAEPQIEKERKRS